MENKTEIIKAILRRALNNLEVLYDIENTTEKEFKDTYGYTKKEIKEVLN